MLGQRLLKYTGSLEVTTTSSDFPLLVSSGSPEFSVLPQPEVVSASAKVIASKSTTEINRFFIPLPPEIEFSFYPVGLDYVIICSPDLKGVAGKTGAYVHVNFPGLVVRVYGSRSAAGPSVPVAAGGK